MSPIRPVEASPARRSLRAVLTLALTGLCLWYIVAKIDFAESWRVLSNSRLSLVALAFAIVLLALVPLSWRWQRLLEAREIHERVRWLLRAYLVSYTASQVLPTSLGGDATRIVETSRRHPGKGGAVAGSVLLERGLGGVATLLLGALGFVLAIGRYSIGPYVWLELVMALGDVRAGDRSLLATRAPSPRTPRAEARACPAGAPAAVAVPRPARLP